MKAPLFRVCIAKTENNVYLLSDFHHIIFDGGSLNIFMHQIKDAYEGKNIFTVQFHPEACPGPQDSSYLFDRFMEMMGGNK